MVQFWTKTFGPWNPAPDRNYEVLFQNMHQITSTNIAFQLFTFPSQVFHDYQMENSTKGWWSNQLWWRHCYDSYSPQIKSFKRTFIFSSKYSPPETLVPLRLYLHRIICFCLMVPFLRSRFYWRRRYLFNSPLWLVWCWLKMSSGWLSQQKWIR